jgi:plastocyanin
MRNPLLGLAALTTLLTTVPREGVAQETYVVSLYANPAKDDYRFEPKTLAVRPNDVIVFRVASGAPHSIVFEGEGLSPGVRGAFNSALEGRSGDLSSPLLTATGKDYRMVVPQVPSGRYRFYCLPHRAYDMRGELVIK